MSGSTANVTYFSSADVYIGDVDSATTPVDSTSSKPDGSDFDENWDKVGLLSGDDGFTESANFDSDSFFAWGGTNIGSSSRNFKLTRQFSAFERNETVMSLRYNTDDVTFNGDGTYAGSLGNPDLDRHFKIAFEINDGNGNIERFVSTSYAKVEEFGDVQQSESNGPATIPVTVTIFPDDDGKLWDAFKGAKSTS
jgi:hypothetical protein